MRTTLDVEDALLRRARRHAADVGTTLTDVVERALRHFLMQKPVRGKPLASRWVVVKGRRPPAVDISDRDRLYEAMGGRGL